MTTESENLFDNSSSYDENAEGHNSNDPSYSSFLHHGSPTRSSSAQYSKSNGYSQSNSEIENAKLKLKNKELKNRLKLMEQKHKADTNNLSSELDLARHEGQESRKQLVITAKELEKQLSEQIKINNKLNKGNKLLQAQISNFLEGISSVTGRNIQSLNEASSVYEELSAEYSSSSKRIRQLEDQNSSLSEQLDDANGMAKKKAGESMKLKKELKRIQESLQSSSQDGQSSQDDVIQQQKKEIQKLKRQLNQKVDEPIEKVSNISDSLEDSQNSTKDEISKANMALLNDRAITAEKNCAALQNQLETLQFENNQLAERGNDLAAQLDEANENVKTRDDMISKLKMKLKQMKGKMGTIVNELKAKETENAELDTTIHELNLQIGELENQIQKEFDDRKKCSNKREIDNGESTRELKEKVELLETRANSCEELYEEQYKEISQLFEQRTCLINTLKQLDDVLASNETTIQQLTKDNQTLSQENERILKEVVVQRDMENDSFKQVFEDSLETAPQIIHDDLADLADQFLNCNRRPKSLTHADVLRAYIGIMHKAIEETEKNAHQSNDTVATEKLRNKYVVVLSHLQNAYKFLKQIANSQATFNNGNDEQTRSEFLASCARLGRFIEEENVEFPIDEFKPSVFEPSDMNDPQKVADVFLDFVQKDELESSPISELFTLFMCVSQINLILMNNVDSNKESIKEAARIKQQNGEQSQQLQDYEQEQTKRNEQLENLKPYLNHLVEEPSEDVDELINQILTGLNHEDVPSPSLHKQLISKLDDLDDQMTKLQEEIEKSQSKTENRRDEFCKRAEDLVSDVQKQVETQMKKFNEEKQGFIKEIEQLKEDNQGVTKEYENKLKKQQRKLQKRDDLINTLRSENESLTQKSIEFQQQLSQHQSQVEEETGTITGLREQMQQLREELNHVKEQKQAYKQRLNESEIANQTTLSDLKQRSEMLDKKYSKTIEDYQKQLKEANEELKIAKEELEQSVERKRELQESNAKLQMAKRTSELKLKQADEALKRERESQEARQTTFTLALKAKNAAAIERLTEDLENCSKTFITILSEVFAKTVEMENSEDKHQQIEDLIKEINDELANRKLDDFAIKDAMKLRRLMNLNKNESLIKLFEEIKKSLEYEKRRADQAEAFAADSIQATEKMQRDSKKLERNTNELNEWIIWSRSLLHQISDTASPNPPSNEVRYQLEEALLAGLDQQTSRRKLEILRTEKKLIKQSPKSTLAVLLQQPVGSKNTNKVVSLRPMTLAMIFTNRLQQFSGNVPSKFNGLTRANASNQAQTDYETRKAPRPLVPYESQ